MSLELALTFVLCFLLGVFMGRRSTIARGRCALCFGQPTVFYCGRCFELIERPSNSPTGRRWEDSL